MNFNSLSSNEKLAVYGAIAVILGILIASGGFFGFGLGLLALIAAIAMLVIVFLPQLSSGTSLPGSARPGKSMARPRPPSYRTVTCWPVSAWRKTS